MTRRILADFKRGLSVIGLARKYGRTKQQITDCIRRAMR
jgi:Mor family transcriptional regulator